MNFQRPDIQPIFNNQTGTAYSQNPTNLLQAPTQNNQELIFYEYEIVDKKKEKEWAYKKLRKHGLCVCQRWAFLLAGNIFILVLTIGLIGLLLFINSPNASSKSPLTYENACTQGSTECNIPSGLYCPNGKCICSSNKNWNGSDCVCPTNQFWDGYNCLTSVSYGGYCSSLVPCVSYLICDSTSNTCNCTNTTYYSSGQCLNKLSYGSSCTSYTQCQSYNSLTCSTVSFCNCYSEFYWNGTACLPQKLNGTTCASTTECKSVAGLSCVTGSPSLCLCSSSFYWNGTYCVPKGLYGSSGCNANYMCDSTKNLICYTGGAACSCPTVYGINVCDCPTGTFYDTQSCIARKNAGSPCSQNYGCMSGTCLYGICI